MSPSEGRWPGRRRRVAAVALLCAFAAVVTACSAGSPASPSAASVATTSPDQMWLAVVGSAEDPNDLDAQYAELVDAVGEGSVTQIVVSPSACYSGLPQRYDGRYVLGVSDATEHAARALLGSAGAHEAWIGAVTSTCVD